MDQRDGFDFIREAQRRMAEEARGDGRAAEIGLALGLVATSVFLVCVSAGWLL